MQGFCVYIIYGVNFYQGLQISIFSIPVTVSWKLHKTNIHNCNTTNVM